MTPAESLPRPSSDGPPVPLLVDGVIDSRMLAQLFADLVTHARILGIQEKNGPRLYAAASTLTLDTAKERLLSGAARAVQLRYEYEGVEWADTILSSGSGFRVIRCQLPRVSETE